MINLKEAYYLAKTINEDPDLVLKEAFETNEYYCFDFLPKEVYVDIGGTITIVNKDNGEVKEIAGFEIGELYQKSKKISIKRIKEELKK